MINVLKKEVAKFQRLPKSIRSSSSNSKNYFSDQTFMPLVDDFRIIYKKLKKQKKINLKVSELLKTIGSLEKKLLLRPSEKKQKMGWKKRKN